MTYWQKEESGVSSAASTWHNPKTQTTKAVDTVWKNNNNNKTLFILFLNIHLFKKAQ